MELPANAPLLLMIYFYLSEIAYFKVVVYLIASINNINENLLSKNHLESGNHHSKLHRLSRTLLHALLCLCQHRFPSTLAFPKNIQYRKKGTDLKFQECPGDLV